MKRRGLSDARIASLVLLAATLAYAAIVRPAERAIAGETIALGALRRERDADDRMLTLRGRLVDVRAKALDALDGITTTSSLADLEAVFLRESERIAQRDGVTLESVEAGAPVAAGKAASAPLFDGIAFDLSVAGRYSDVLAFVGDLSRTSALIEVTGTSLSRKQHDIGEAERYRPDAPKVGAAVRAVAYRVDRNRLARLRNEGTPRALP